VLCPDVLEARQAPSPSHREDILIGRGITAMVRSGSGRVNGLYRDGQRQRGGRVGDRQIEPAFGDIEHRADCAERGKLQWLSLARSRSRTSPRGCRVFAGDSSEAISSTSRERIATHQLLGLGHATT